MPSINRLTKAVSQVKSIKNIQWHPGHMYSGMQAMIGKLNRVDCVIEVHDARIPFIGRNTEFRRHLGTIKPHLLVLNKIDLADTRDWEKVQSKLKRNGDENVISTDLSGSDCSHAKRGYHKLLQKAMDLVHNTGRFNRDGCQDYNIMIVGIPNVGKSTLINRLRQHHLGLSGNATKVGSQPGVTKVVEFKIKICSKPRIYSLDTPGVLQPSATKSYNRSMQLALCSAINDKVLSPVDLASFLLDHLNQTGNQFYVDQMFLTRPTNDIMELSKDYLKNSSEVHRSTNHISNLDEVCWYLIKLFRSGRLGKVMFM